MLSAIFAALADLDEDPVVDRQAALDVALSAAVSSNEHPAACTAAIVALAEANADPNAPASTRDSNDGLPPLQALIAGMRRRRHWREQEVAAAVQALLSAGADPCSQSSVGLSPLDFAAACPHPAAVRACIPALLAAGASPTDLNGMGEPPLASAASNSCSEAAVAAIQLLLDAGADPLPGPTTALHGLAENSSAEAAGAAAAALATAISARWAETLAAWAQERADAEERQRQAEEAEAALRAGQAQQAAAWAQERQQLAQREQQLVASHQATVKMLYDHVLARQQEVRGLQEEQERVQACVVCMHEARSTALQCGHLAMCASCTAATAGASGQLRCPICREPSSTTLTIHIP